MHSLQKVPQINISFVQISCRTIINKFQEGTKLWKWARTKQKAYQSIPVQKSIVINHKFIAQSSSESAQNIAR